MTEVGLFVLEGECVVTCFDERLYEEFAREGRRGMLRAELARVRPTMTKRAFYRYRGRAKRWFDV